MITKLNNLKTKEYYELKQAVDSKMFPWFYQVNSTTDCVEGYDNIPFYGHSFLTRPEPEVKRYFPVSNSDQFDFVSNLIVQILDFNNIKLNCFFRINANATHPSNLNKLTVPHYDHPWQHNNLLIYLNDAGGETVVFGENGEKEEYHPKEDDVIMFSGLHCHRPPKENRRLVLVATFA